MSRIGQYLLSVVAAALLISILNVLVEKKGAISSVIKLITGIALAMMIVSPWIDFQISHPVDTYLHIEADGLDIVQGAEESAQREVAAYIKSRVETYILDKAHELGLDLTAEVVLNDETYPTVAKVSICGSAAPYTKRQMIFLICEDLGITEECLTWSQSSG